MGRHRNIRLMIYDYLRGELREEDARMVRDHLLSCRACEEEASGIRSMLRIFPARLRRPSDSRDAGFWDEFASTVEKRSRREHDQAAGIPDRVRDFLGDLVLFRPGFAYGMAAAGAIAVIIVTMMTVRWETGRPVPDAEGGVAAVEKEAIGEAGPADSLTEFDLRVGNYFRKSRTLLVGVSNMDPGGGHSNFEGERRASRSLLREARYLRSGPVDFRSSKLIEELDQVMITLANTDTDDHGGGVELARTGIRNKNLLFKIRMQEQRLTAPAFRQASYRKEGDLK